MKIPLRLAIFVHFLDDVGGAEMATRRLANGLVKRGHFINILTTQSFSQWRRKKSILKADGALSIIRLPVWQRSQSIFDYMLLIEAVGAFFLLRKSQLLHTVGFTRSSIWVAQIAKRFGMKVICRPMASGPYGDIAMLPRNISRSSAKVFDWVTCLTEGVREDVIGWGYPAERTSVIPNGVDINFYTPSSKLPHPQSAVFVGQFRPEKRIDLVLDAWKLIQTHYPDAQLTLVGGKSEHDEYEILARSMGLNIIFLPILPVIGVLEQLRQHAIFIMSGVSEGMSNALLEAMSTGLAPIVSNTPGNQAVVINGSNGLTYESTSAASLAEALRYLFDHPNERQQLAQQARETIVQNFSIDIVTDKYIQLYLNLLK